MEEINRSMQPSCGLRIMWIFSDEKRELLIIVPFAVTLGLILGLTLPASQEGYYTPVTARLSSVIGWIYMLAWIVSFCPQLISNWYRKSVVGMSLDGVLLTSLGFICYAIYTFTLKYSDNIIDQYHVKYGELPIVSASDVFFCVWALLLEGVALYQIALYERGTQYISKWSWFMLAIAAVYIVMICILTAAGTGVLTTWLEGIMFISYVKLVMTVIRYLPQIVLNFQRKSTQGFNTTSVVLDFVGGSFSLAQLILDCAAQQSWAGIAGDPVKLMLGLLTLLYDLVFMFQRFVLYPDAAAKLAHRYEHLDALEGDGRQALQP